jgi:hypothetical protein
MTTPQPDGPKGLINPVPFFQQRLNPSSAPTLATSGQLFKTSGNSPTNLSSSGLPLPLQSPTIQASELKRYNNIHKLIAEDDENVVSVLQSALIDPLHPIDLNFQHESLYNSCTFLMHACYRQNLPLVLYLLSFTTQIDLNLQNFYSQESALFYAIVHNPIFTETTVHIVRELVQHDIDPNLRDSQELSVLFVLMKRSCEALTDFFLDIVATLLASTIPIAMTISTKDVANITPLRFLLVNRYQQQRDPLMMELVQLLLEHRQSELDEVLKSKNNLVEHYRHSIKSTSARTDQHQNILPYSDTMDPSNYLVLGLPEVDYAYQPYQSFFPVVFAFMHPQPSYPIIKFLLNSMPDVKIRSILGPNRCTILYTLFQYIELLDDEVIQIIQYVIKLHSRQAESENKRSNLLKTIVGMDSVSHYPPRDLVGPKLLAPIPLPLLTASDGTLSSAPPTPVNANTSFGSKRGSAFGFGLERQKSVESFPNVPSYLSQNANLFSQLHTLHTNLSKVESDIISNPSSGLGPLFDLNQTQLELFTSHYFQQYPQTIQHFDINSGHYVPHHSTNDFYGTTPEQQLQHALRITETQSIVPLISHDYHPFTMSSNDGHAVWPVNKQVVITVPLISSFFFHNRWRWSRNYQQICEIITGGQLKKLYPYIHLLLLSPNPDYSIFYRLASLHHQNSKEDNSYLPIIERGLIYFFSNPNIDAPDCFANTTPTTSAPQIPSLANSSLTAGLPNPLSPSGPYQIPNQTNQNPGLGPNNDVVSAFNSGRLSIYTHQQRISVIARLTQQTKPKSSDLMVDNNITNLASFLIKHFRARPNVTVRCNNSLITCISAILGNSAISFETSIALFDQIISTRLSQTGTTYIPSSVVLFWSDGSLALPKPRDLPTLSQSLIPIEMALYEAIEWFITQGNNCNNYLNFTSLIYVLTKLRGVKLNDFKRGSSLWVLGEKMMNISRISQEERNAKLNSQAHLESGDRERRGTVTTRDRKQSVVPKNAPNSPPGGRRGTIQGGAPPGQPARRGTILNGSAPNMARQASIVDGPECDKWSLMTLLLAFGNYEAVGIFELYCFLTTNGNPMQPAPTAEYSLINTHKNFGQYYKNTISPEPIGDVFKFIFNNAARSGGRNVHVPNFCSNFGQFIFRRGLFLLQYIIKTEEIHPQVIIYYKIIQNQKALSSSSGNVSFSGSSLPLHLLTQQTSTSTNSSPESTNPNRGYLDESTSEIIDNYSPNGQKEDDYYEDDHGDDFGDEDHDEDGEVSGDFGATPSQPHALSEDAEKHKPHTHDNFDDPLQKLIRQNAMEFSPAALHQQWVYPEWSPFYFGPKYSTYNSRCQQDKDFPFIDVFVQSLLQTVVNTPNPNRVAQYYVLQFILVCFGEQLKTSTTAPLKYDLSSFSSEPSSPSFGRGGRSLREGSQSPPPVNRASSTSDPESLIIPEGIISEDSEMKVGVLDVVGEDEISPLRSITLDNSSSVGMGSSQVPLGGARHRRSTISGSNNPARARSSSRQRGSVLNNPSGGGGDKQTDITINITPILMTSSAYDFYSILILVLIEEYFSTSANLPLQITHLLPLATPRFANDLSATHDYHSLTRLQSKTATPTTLYSRSSLLTLLSMVHLQPVTIVYLYLVEYYLRRYYHRLQSHLAIEVTRSVVIQICTPIQFSPLLLFLQYSKLNRTLNHYLPTLLSSGHHQMSLSNAVYTPSLTYDLDHLYQLPVTSLPIMSFPNTSADVFIRHHRDHKNLISTPIRLLGSNQYVNTSDVMLYTPQLINILAQFETDYARWIQPIDPSHLRAMYKHRSDHLHTGGRYNYKQTIAYSINLLTYFFLTYRLFYLKHSSSFSSVHALITSILLQNGHCPNYSIHDDDDLQNISENFPTPLHALLLNPNGGLVHSPATISIVESFFNNPNFDPECGLNDALIHLPFKSRSAVTVHQFRLLQNIVRSNVNILRCDTHDITTVLHHAFSAIQRPNIYSHQNFKSIAYLLSAGVSPFLTYQTEDHALVGFIIQNTGGSALRFDNNPRSKHSDLWQTQLLIIFYAYFFLTPNNIAPNSVLALALHPNQIVKQLLFGIENWESVKPTASERTWAESYFTNPLHFGNTTTNAAASAVTQQGNSSLSSSYFTPGFVSLGSEFNIEFILKYKNQSLEVFLKERQIELSKNPSIDYNVYDLLVLLDQQRNGVVLPSFFSIAQRFKQSQTQLHPQDLLLTQQDAEKYFRRNPEQHKLFTKHRNEVYSCFPDTTEREKDQTVYKGILWFLSDYTNTLSVEDATTLLSISKSKLSSIGYKLISELYNNNGCLSTTLTKLKAEHTSKNTQCNLYDILTTSNAAQCPPNNPPLESHSVTSAHGNPSSTTQKLLKPIDISQLEKDDSLIDCTAVNSFRENIIHIAILRRWPAQTIKAIYLEAAYQFRQKFDEICLRAHLPQHEQIELERTILEDPSTPEADQALITSLRQQHTLTNGTTPTKFLLDYLMLFRDARGYSPLQYFYFTAYDLDDGNYMDQLFNHQYLSSFVSVHHVQYTRYLEYQTFSTQNAQRFPQQQSTTTIAPSSNGVDSEIESLSLTEEYYATLPPAQRAFLQLTANKIDSIQEGDETTQRNSKLNKYDFSLQSGNFINQAQKLPFFSSLVLHLTFDFNLFQPLPTDSRIFSTLTPSPTLANCPNLYQLFKAKQPLPIALIPPINLDVLHQGHLWINMFDYNLGKNTPKPLQSLLLQYSINYDQDHLEKHLGQVCSLSYVSARSGPSLGSLSLTQPVPGNNANKIFLQHPYLQKLSGGTPLSPKPKLALPGLIEVPSSNDFFGAQNKDRDEASNDDESSQDNSTLHESSTSNLQSNLYLLTDEETKHGNLSPLTEDDVDTNKAALLQKLGTPAENDFYGQNALEEIDSEAISTFQKNVSDSDLSKDPNSSSNEIKTPLGNSPGPSNSLRTSLRFNTLPAAFNLNRGLLTVYQASKIDPIDPSPPAQNAVFDYDGHIYDPSMSVNGFLVLTKDGIHRKLINSYAHNNISHTKMALLTQQSLHEFLFKVQQITHYQSLSFQDQLGIEIISMSDDLNTFLDYTKFDTIPNKPEVFVRRLSHSSSALILHRKPRNRSANPQTPQSPGDAVITPISNIPVSKQILATNASFLQPLSYSRYFNLRYAFPSQQLKTIPFRSPTWLQYTKMLFYLEFQHRDYSKWCLPPFAYSHIIHDHIQTTTAAASPPPKSDVKSPATVGNTDKASTVATPALDTGTKNNKTTKNSDTNIKDGKDRGSKRPVDDGKKPSTNTKNKEQIAPPEPSTSAGCCSIM